MALWRPKDSKGKRSKVWWYSFEFEGIEYRESTKVRNKALARDVLDARRREVALGFNGLKKRDKPKIFSIAVNEHLAAKNGNVAPSTFEIMKRCAAHLIAFFGKMRLIEITAADIKQYKGDRLSPRISPRYVNMDLELIRAVLRRNALWERVRPDFSFYRLEDEYGFELPEADEPKLLDECKLSIARGLFTIIILALCTGMRKGEIKFLRWNHIFLEGEAFLIVGVSKTKTGRRRRIPLNARAVAALKEWGRQFPDRLPDHYVFPAEKYSKQHDGMPAIYRHDPTSPMGSCRGAWKACCRRAGVNMRFHDLRHTAVSRMLRAKTPLTTVAAIVGWSPSTMYIMAKRYAHILQPEMRQAVAALEGAVLADVPTPTGNSPKSSAVSAQVTSRYDREELYEKVWKVPMQTVAREYGVSDVAMGKTCRKLHVPVPGRGYWAKKAAQKPVPARPPLPALNEHGPNRTEDEPDSAMS
jgi:integrase